MKRYSLSSILFLFCIAPLASGCIIDADSDSGTELRTAEFIFSVEEATFNDDVASAQYSIPDITPVVVDQGAVLGFFREQGTWTAMPYTFGVESPDLPAVDYTITMGYGYDDGIVEVFYEASTVEAPIDLQPDRRIKIVILDDLAFSRQANIDLTDYESLKKHFNLSD